MKTELGRRKAKRLLRNQGIDPQQTPQLLRKLAKKSKSQAKRLLDEQ